MKQVLWFLSGLALVIWYAIDGWHGVFHAALAVLFGGGMVALLLKWRNARKQSGQRVTWPTTGPLPHASDGLREASTKMWIMVAAIEAGEYELPQFAEEEDRP